MIFDFNEKMLKIHFSFFLLLCSIVTFGQPYDAETRVRTTIRNYIDTQFKDNQILHYDYSNLFVHKPIQYQQLDSLNYLRDSLESYNYKSQLPYIDTAIYYKQKEIIDLKIRFSYEMEHEFIVEKSDNLYELYSFTFFVSHNYQVKDLEAIYKVELNKKDKDLYYQFVEETPLFPFERKAYLMEKMKSPEIYRLYKTGLLMYPESADEILHAGFSLMRNILKYQEIDRQKLLNQQAAEYLESHYKLSAYKRYSDYEKIQINGEDAGYKMYVEFVQPGEDDQIVAVYLEFDIYSVVLGHEQLNAPWDEYFKK